MKQKLNEHLDPNLTHASSLSDCVTLNNGIKMPPVGYGVFRMTDEKECEKAVFQALELGYRLIDTAAAYENEKAVGRAIKKSGISRKDLFITTKLWITDTCYEKAKDAFYRSLDRLDMDYVDLYLIHQPYHDYYGAWKVLEELYTKGTVKAIGVDNFTQEKLADFLFFQKVKPAVNMVECNAFYQREEDLAYMKEQNIQMQAWSPLAAGADSIFSNPVLSRIASEHKKSIAQIVLRWLVQRGIVPVVKSADPVRMKDNINIFDFELTPAQMNDISALDTGYSCFGERKSAGQVTSFLNTALQYNV